MKKKVVLAFSGGLDTSYCALYLSQEKNLDVYSVVVNTGGFSESDLMEIEKKAIALGVKTHQSLDMTEKYYDQCIRYLVYGNVLRNNTYPLSVSAERVFQALAIAEYTAKIEADYVAHGSTGAGNDQIRFDMIFHIMLPGVGILTPIRDQNITRDEEIKFLKEQGIKMPWQKLEYSVNKGLWGTSVGGKETLTSNQPLPEGAYPTSVTQTGTTDLEITFDKGEFKGYNGKLFQSIVDGIISLNEFASPWGIGRDIHVGDTIIGIKGRVGFEAAAAILIIKAHEAIEKHTLGKWQIYWKEQLANWYGMHLHEGHYLDPVMRDIETFLENTQSCVTGSVSLSLFNGHFKINGIKSDNDLMSAQFAQYGEVNSSWSGEDTRGFAKILANSTSIYHAINKEKSS